MHVTESTLLFSATDVSNFLACPHLSLVDRHSALGGPKPPKFDDPGAEVLRKRGHAHEQAYLARLEAEGLEAVRIEDPDLDVATLERWQEAADRTLDAMRGGAEVIYQGTLFDGTWVGRPDFLRRVDQPSDLGDWSYEVTDAKLAREAKGGALLQLCVYSELLEKLQGKAPEHAHLALGRPERRAESFRLADYMAYYRSVKRRFEAAIAAAAHTPPKAPDPVPHCDICAWQTRCDAERREADHLALTAGITRRQRQALTERGITTMAGLATLPLPVEPPSDGVSRIAAEKIREQARIQVEGREAGEPRYELLTPVREKEGLARLPPPSPGDLFFDMEGDPPLRLETPPRPGAPGGRPPRPHRRHHPAALFGANRSNGRDTL